MEKDEPPRVVDLSRYRQAAARRAAQAEARPKPPPRSERLLGSRPGAGLILAVLLALLLAFWLGPTLTSLL